MSRQIVRCFFSALWGPQGPAAALVFVPEQPSSPKLRQDMVAAGHGGLSMEKAAVGLSGSGFPAVPFWHLLGPGRLTPKDSP